MRSDVPSGYGLRKQAFAVSPATIKKAKAALDTGQKLLAKGFDKAVPGLQVAGGGLWSATKGLSRAMWEVLNTPGRILSPLGKKLSAVGQGMKDAGTVSRATGHAGRGLAQHLGGESLRFTGLAARHPVTTGVLASLLFSKKKNNDWD